MKKTILRTFCSLVLGAAVVLPQLASAQANKPASAVSLADMRSQLSRLQIQVSATVNALNEVKQAAKKPAELSKAAADLGNDYQTLQTMVDSVQTNAVTAKARVKDHYDAWSKELTGMSNAKLREKAQERLTQSQKEFDKIVALSSAAKEQVLPFVSQTKDIVIYLGADLSEEAVKSLSNDIWKLDGKAASVNKSIKDVVDQIDRTIKSLPQK